MPRDVEQLKKAIVQLANIIDGLAWRAATKEEREKGITVAEEIEAILEA